MANQIVGTLNIQDGGKPITSVTVAETLFNDNFTIDTNGVITATGDLRLDSASQLDIFGDSSCIALYGLDGNTNDLLGNYNGIATDITYVDGKFGQACAFNGSTSKVEIPSIGDGSAVRSASVWFNETEVVSGSASRLILGDRDNSNLRFVITAAACTVGNDSVKGVINYSAPLNTWNNVVVVVESSSVFRVYLNGVDQGFASYTNSGDLKLYLGYRDSYTDQYKGLIDQVRIFNKALTAEEVSTLYNGDINPWVLPQTFTATATNSRGSTEQTFDISVVP